MAVACLLQEKHLWPAITYLAHFFRETRINRDYANSFPSTLTEFMAIDYRGEDSPFLMDQIQSICAPSVSIDSSSDPDRNQTQTTPYS
jgi:hypothetical protein